MEELAAVLEEIANKLGLAVNELWPHMVHYTYVQAWFNLILGVGCWCLFFWGFRGLYFTPAVWKSGYDEIPPGVKYIVALVIGGVLGMLALETGIVGILEPTGSTIYKFLK